MQEADHCHGAGDWDAVLTGLMIGDCPRDVSPNVVFRYLCRET